MDRVLLLWIIFCHQEEVVDKLVDDLVNLRDGQVLTFEVPLPVVINVSVQVALFFNH